jgi:hypothetical protein
MKYTEQKWALTIVYFPVSIFWQISNHQKLTDKCINFIGGRRQENKFKESYSTIIHKSTVNKAIALKSGDIVELNIFFLTI